MNVGEIMTRDVLTIDSKAPLLRAVRLMIDRGVSGMPVVGAEGEVVGILTEGDLLRRAETDTTNHRPGFLTRLLLPGREARDYIRTHGRRVEEIMTTPVSTIAEEASLDDAVEIMQQRRVRRLPVLRDGKLIGIISRADIIRRLGALLPSEIVHADDAAIRNAIVAQIAEQSWAPRHDLQISVEQGVVQLDGCVVAYHAREALGVLAENTPGVRLVENRIIYVEPTVGVAVDLPEMVSLPPV